jgi:amino acid permease
MKSKLTGRQIGQIIIATLALALIVVQLLSKSSSAKVIGVPANACLILAMILSFIAEEKKKKEEKE